MAQEDKTYFVEFSEDKPGYVYLSGYGFPRDSFAEILEKCDPNGVHVDGYWGTFTDSDLELIASIPKITQFDTGEELLRAANRDQRAMKALASMTSLTQLSIPLKDCSGISRLANIPELEELTLRFSRFSDEHAPDLIKLKQIQYLDLRSAEITDLAVGHLQRLRWLRNMNLSGTKVSRQAHDHLEAVMKRTAIIHQTYDD